MIFFEECVVVNVSLFVFNNINGVLRTTKELTIIVLSVHSNC